MKMNQYLVWTMVLVGVVAGPVSAQSAVDEQLGTRMLVAANGLLERDMYELAKQEYEAFLLKYPKHPKVMLGRYGLGVCHYNQKNYTQAAFQLEKVVADKTFSPRDDALAVLGHCYMATSEYGSSVRVFEELVKEFPKSRHCQAGLMNLAQSYYMLRESAKALDVFERFREKYPESERTQDVLYLMAVCQNSLKRYDKTAELLKDLLARYPKTQYKTDSLLMLGQAYEEQGKYERASDRYRQMLKEAPENRKDEGYYSLGLVLYKMGQYTQAAEALNRIVATYPESRYMRSARMQMGLAYFAANDYDKALATFEVIVAKDSVYASSAEYWLAQSYMARGRFAEALPILRRLSNATPPMENLAQIEFDMATCEMELQKYPAAAARYAAFRKKRSDHSLGWHAAYRQAWCLHQIQRYSESQVVCLEILGQAAGEIISPARELLAENLFLLKKYDAAEKVYQKLVTRDEGNMLWLLRWGQCAYYQAEYEQAIERLAKLSKRKEVESDSNLRECLFLLGHAQLQMKDYVGAVSSLQRYVGLEKEIRPQAMYYLAQGLRKLGRDDQANERLDKVIAGDSELKDPWSVRSAYDRALYAYDHDDPERAETLLKAVLKAKAPARIAVQATYMTAWLDFNAKKYEAAASGFENLVKSWPDNLLARESLYYQGIALHNAGKFREALDVLQKFVASYPDDPNAKEARSVIGRCLSQMGDKTKAIDELSQLAANSETRTASVLYQLAWLRRDKGNTDGAIRTYQAMIQEFPKDRLSMPARVELAELLAAEKEYRVAVNLLEEVLQSENVSPETRRQALYRLGFALTREKPERAAKVFAKYVEEYPNSEETPSAVFEAGVAYGASGEHNNARKQFAIFLQKYPEHKLREVAMLKIAEAQGGAGLYQDAAGSYQKFLKQFPQSKFRYLAEYGMGWVLENQQKYRQARDWYEKVIRTHSGSTAASAQLQIGRTLFLEGQYMKAAKELVKVDIVYQLPTQGANALYEAGRAFEMARRLDQARQEYGRCLQKYPGTPPANLASQRLQMLEGKD